jgi:predicted extracellular nuclease
MLRSFPFIIAFSIVTSAFAFRTALKNAPPTTVVFYNVENLFDTIDTPDVQDEDFTPSGKLNWNTERYQKKLKDLSGVLAAASAPALPLAFGLCEIENRAVVEDLVSTDALKKGSYKVVHADSPDARGIDVAFAYDASRMKELHHEAIRVHFDFEPETRTRDILYVKTLFKKDTLHFFINHWPSRRSGQQESEARRLVPAHIVRHRSDSLMKIDPQARIIIMGDFNDYPNNASMTEVMKSVPGSGSGLTNLTYALHASGKGSYNYKGEWGMLDQFIVSEGLLKAKRGWAVSDSSASIHEAENLIYVNPKNGDRSPSKTYGGDKYYGGFSDHLPIVLRLEQRRIK